MGTIYEINSTTKQVSIVVVEGRSQKTEIMNIVFGSKLYYWDIDRLKTYNFKKLNIQVI